MVSLCHAACTKAKHAVPHVACACRTAGSGVLGLAADLIQTMLLEAAVDGDLATLQSFLDVGFDLNTVITRPPDLPWQSCYAATPATPVMAATMAGQAEAVRLLLDGGADPDVVPRGTRTALCIAAQHGNCNIVRMLLEAGAKPLGRCPPHMDLAAVYAARAYWDALQLWRDGNLSDASTRAILSKAEDCKRCFRMLLDATRHQLRGSSQVCVGKSHHFIGTGVRVHMAPLPLQS